MEIGDLLFSWNVMATVVLIHVMIEHHTEIHGVLLRSFQGKRMDLVRKPDTKDRIMGRDFVMEQDLSKRLDPSHEKNVLDFIQLMDRVQFLPGILEIDRERQGRGDPYRTGERYRRGDPYRVGGVVNVGHVPVGYGGVYVGVGYGC